MPEGLELVCFGRVVESSGFRPIRLPWRNTATRQYLEGSIQSAAKPTTTQHISLNP